MNSKLILVSLLVFSAILVISSFVLAADDETVTVDVNVSSQANFVVVPVYLNWTAVGTGSAGGTKQVTLKNTGSLNISNIYVYTDTLTDETTRPYQSSTSTDYAAGGVLTLKNETDSWMYYIGRIEWNWTEDIPNHNWFATSPVTWGYFRNTSHDYVWVIGNGSAAADGTGIYCNNTGTQFGIEYDEDLGRLETRTPITVGARVAGDANWSYFYVSDSSSPIYRSCVATSWNCTKMYIYHYDKRAAVPTAFNSCGSAMYLHHLADDSTKNLVPGHTIILTLDAWVPNGIPAGNLTTATVTFVAAG